jgi:hypothetical protein
MLTSTADDDYVYDTYILSSHPSTLPTTLSQEPYLAEATNVGYIVLTDDDALLWDSYLPEDPNAPNTFAAGGDEDDEDENAEDWYGTEYPEDEVASDDEFGRDEYRFQREDEEWDGRSDGVEWSDGEDGEGAGEMGRMKELLKMTPEEFLRRLRDADGEGGGG